MRTLNVASTDNILQIVALRSRVEAAGIGATAWLVMIMQLTGHNRLVNRRSLLILGSVPVLFSSLLLN